MMDQKFAQQITDNIMAMYDAKGHLQYGEELTQLQHMIQSAVLAEEEGYDEEVILAAFLHDVGHFLDQDADLMGDVGVRNHEVIGARYLVENGFSWKIGALVEGHVQAKRYLCFADANYFDGLSAASRKTLGYQGGVMTSDEAAEFESDPLFDLHIRMRIWDDMGKRADLEFDVQDKYREMILRHLTRKD